MSSPERMRPPRQAAPESHGGRPKRFETHNTTLAARLYFNPDAFRGAMHEAGLDTDSAIIADGEIHRFKADGDKRPNGWYVCFGHAGAFGNWRTGTRGTWSAGGVRRDDELRREVAEAQARHRAKIEAGHQRVKRKAAGLWAAGSPVTSHPYLSAKGVQSHGLRLINERLAVPVTIEREVWSLQLIDSNGRKRFLPGGKVSGGYFGIGEPSKRLWLAEGYATGASVHEATGDAVAVTFNAGNLAQVARALMRRFPGLRLFVAADNDEAGRREADKCLSCGVSGRIAPEVVRGVTDWNDYAERHGIEATRKGLREVLGHE